MSTYILLRYGYIGHSLYKNYNLAMDQFVRSFRGVAFSAALVRCRVHGVVVGC